ncbi:MAG: Crp/Fnr family transcriptional regulator [Bacteroidales bacterium]|nr:Crp/Fnr family transcriptional regulator [Bacteroidales bacterium]
MSFLDVLLQTPIFQGVSKLKLTTCLEKHCVEFLKYKAGETVVSQGDDFTHLKFLISGKLLTITPNKALSLEIKEIFGSPNLIFGNYIFGIETSSNSTCIAHSDVGIMQIAKEDLLELLRKEPIFMINYLNFLSARSQTYYHTMLSVSAGDLNERFALWVLLLTHKKAEESILAAKIDEMAKLLGDSKENLIAVLQDLKRKKLVTYNDNEIRILNRHAFADIVHDEDLD